MPTWARRASACACAALILAAAVATAAANRLQTSSQQVRATWAPLTFTLGRGLGVVRCDVTLEGSFHNRTFTKTRASLVGYVTSAAINSVCNGGELHFLAETLPWHVRYDSFTGTLPRINGIRFQLIGFSLWFTFFGVRCLYRSSTTAPLYVTWFRGEPSEVSSSLALEGTMPPLEGGLCPEETSLEGRSRLTNSGSSTLVTLSLI